MKFMFDNIRSSLIKAVILPVGDMFMSTNIKKSYDLICKMNSYTSSEISEWQSQKLQDLVNHSYANTSYYRDLLDQLKILPTDIRSIEDLKILPPLTKNDVRRNFSRLLANNSKSFPYQRSSTGGSSGDPLIIALDNRSWSFSNANIIHNWEKLGYHYGEKYIALGSTSLFVDKKKSIKHIMYYKLKNKLGLSGINMSDEVCRNYLILLSEQRIKYIYGYATSIYLLAKYALKNNFRVKLEACFPTSEICTPHYKDIITSTFNCKLLDCYGAHDGGITAFEHNRGIFEVGYNSVINYDKSVRSSQPILLTDLLNYSMPLINYSLGDEIIIDSNVICNYNGQVINEVVGRASDVIELENGRVLTGPGFTILFKDLPVEYYSISKENDATVTCRISPLNDFTEIHDGIIRSTLRKQIGEGIEIRIVYTDEIMKGKNGKVIYFSGD